MNLIQLGLDAGILALCCEVVFRQKAEIKAKEFFIFPIFLVICVVTRMDFSIGANMTASFRSEGFEMLPADNIVGLLFLLFAVLLLSSICFGSKSSGTVFCGTMAAFSVFLFVKCLCAVLFAACGATDILLLLGSRVAALCLIVVLEFTPLFGLIHQFVQRSDFTILIVSTNIALLLMTVLSILSFDVDRLLANLWIIIILILAVLLLDSILLFLHQRRMQEQKRIHMIEQYVPTATLRMVRSTTRRPRKSNGCRNVLCPMSPDRPECTGRSRSQGRTAMPLHRNLLGDRERKFDSVLPM